ncbi:MAG: Bax inhibitor-1/YccA family protein [Actinomycetota bacterium]
MASAYPVASTPVQALDADTRQKFIARTYGHLTGAILGFTAIEVFLFSMGLAEPIASAMLGTSWLLILGGFVLVGWLASRAAHSARSQGAQYAALGAMVVAQAIIFVPLLVIANTFAPGAISSAAIVTIVGFIGLTVVAVATGKDFSFLRGILMWAGIGALLLIVGSVIFGFQLGTFFSVGMVVFAGAAILYDTSNVLRHYPQDRYVAAALELFASVALMFWYVLRLFISSRD